MQRSDVVVRFAIAAVLREGHARLSERDQRRLTKRLQDHRPLTDAERQALAPVLTAWSRRHGGARVKDLWQ